MPDELLLAFTKGEPESKTAIALLDGHLFDVMNPDTWVWNSDNIARSLANTCRFQGQIANRYSVAEHAVRVSKWLEFQGYDELTQYLGLHHDAVESIIGDIPSPQKRIMTLGGEPIKVVEENLEYSLFAVMGNDVLAEYERGWDDIKRADLAIYLEERSERPSMGVGHSPKAAHDQYMQRHFKLQKSLIAAGFYVNEF